MRSLDKLKIMRTTVFAAVIVLSASSAFANTAANTAIVNTATLSYTGGSVTATATVTVNLVPSTPNVTITNATGAYTAPNTPALNNSVVITSTANGPASYTVTPSVSASTNTTSPSVSGGTTISIGATVTTGTSGTTYITVPASGASGNNSEVNGIGVGDTIFFTVNAIPYTRTVTGTTDNGNGTFTINWATAIPGGDVPAAGVQVGEQVSVPLSVQPGTIVTPGTNITVTVQAVVSTSGAANATVTNSTPNTWTSTMPNISMTKYVRNVTTGAAGTAGAAPWTINGVASTFYTAGVTGKPGDTLEYAIVAANNAGVGAVDLPGCAISDILPVAYVNLVSNYGGNNVFYIDTTGTTSTINALGVGVNQASYVAPNLVVNVGVGANNTTTGTIPVGTSVTVAYQVTIK